MSVREEDSDAFNAMSLEDLVDLLRIPSGIDDEAGGGGLVGVDEGIFFERAGDDGFEDEVGHIYFLPAGRRRSKMGVHHTDFRL